MKNITLPVLLTLPLKQKLEALAKMERRTVENQTVCLIENALRIFEGEGKKRLFCERKVQVPKKSGF